MARTSDTLNFLPRRSRTRLLGGLTVAVVVACGAMLGMLSKGTGQQSALIGDSPETSSAGSRSPTPEKAPKALSTSAVNSVALGLESDTVRYYEAQTGRAFTADLSKSKAAVLSDRKLSGFIQSWWIPGRAAAISSFEQQGTAEYRFTDYSSEAVSVIGNAVTALAVSSDGNRIVFAEAADESSTIRIADVQGSAARTILPTRATDIELSWQSKDRVAVVSRRPGFAGRDLTLVGIDGALSPVFSNAENLEHAWSPDGQGVLYSRYTTGEGIGLWYRGIGGVDIPLGLATGASKCAWHSDSTTVTCGVPNKNTLSRDVPADRVATTDDIVTLDLKTGGLTVHYTARSANLVGVIHPLVSSSGRYLAFINLFDQRLYMLEL